MESEQFITSPFTYFEIINPSGKTTTIQQKWLKFHNPQIGSTQQSSIVKGFDKSVKSTIYSMSIKNSKASIEFLNPIQSSTNYSHNCLVFQLLSWDILPLSLDITLLDDKRQKKRLLFSSSFNSIEINEFHAKIPWNQPNRQTWTNIIFPLDILLAQCFPGSIFERLDSFQLKPCCRIRRIFLISSQLLNLSHFESIDSIKIPLAIDFHRTVIHETYLFTISTQFLKQSVQESPLNRFDSNDISKNIQQQIYMMKRKSSVTSDTSNQIVKESTIKETIKNDLKLLRKRSQSPSQKKSNYSNQSECLPPVPDVYQDNSQWNKQDGDMVHNYVGIEGAIPPPRSSSSRRSSNSISNNIFIAAGENVIKKDYQFLSIQPDISILPPHPCRDTSGSISGSRDMTIDPPHRDISGSLTGSRDMTIDPLRRDTSGLISGTRDMTVNPPHRDILGSIIGSSDMTTDPLRRDTSGSISGSRDMTIDPTHRDISGSIIGSSDMTIDPLRRDISGSITGSREITKSLKSSPRGLITLNDNDVGVHASEHSSSSMRKSSAPESLKSSRGLNTTGNVYDFQLKPTSSSKPFDLSQHDQNQSPLKNNKFLHSSESSFKGTRTSFDGLKNKYNNEIGNDCHVNNGLILDTLTHMNENGFHDRELNYNDNDVHTDEINIEADSEFNKEEYFKNRLEEINSMMCDVPHERLSEVHSIIDILIESEVNYIELYGLESYILEVGDNLK